MLKTIPRVSRVEKWIPIVADLLWLIVSTHMIRQAPDPGTFYYLIISDGLSAWGLITRVNLARGTQKTWWVYFGYSISIVQFLMIIPTDHYFLGLGETTGGAPFYYWPIICMYGLLVASALGTILWFVNKPRKAQS